MAQVKKTDPVELDEELPELTDKQFKFVMAYMEHRNASDAYRAVYDASGMKPESVWVAASNVKRNDKVAVWISALEREMTRAAKYSLDEHMRELEEAKQLCKKSGHYTAYVNAIQLKGKAAGLYVERTEDLTDREKPSPLERIKSLQRKDGQDRVH